MTNPTTGDVLNRHLNAFAERDLAGVLEDYAPDAVLFSPTGPLRGPRAIEPMFRAMIAEFSKPGARFAMRDTWIDGEYACIVWDAETAENRYEFASDMFVVREGKIVGQSFAAKISPKG